MNKRASRGTRPGRPFCVLGSPHSGPGCALDLGPDDRQYERVWRADAESQPGGPPRCGASRKPLENAERYRNLGSVEHGRRKAWALPAPDALGHAGAKVWCWTCDRRKVRLLKVTPVARGHHAPSSRTGSSK